MGGPFEFRSERFVMRPPREKDAREIGYWIDRAVQRKGVAPEAAQVLLEWGETRFGVTQFVASHFQDNPASGRVLEKLGFERVGEKPLVNLARGGEDPAWRYALNASPSLAQSGAI